MADTLISVVEKRHDDGQDTAELRGDEVGRALSGIAERENSRLPVVRRLVSCELGEVVHGEPMTWRGQVGRELVNERERRPDGRHLVHVVVEKVVIHLGDDPQTGGHEPGADVLHALDLHAARVDGLAEESDGLSTGIVLDLSVAGNLDHELHQVLEVGVQERGLVGQERLENLEDVAVVLIVAALDAALQDLHHRGEDGLDGL